jgi:hypothetical protein
LQAELRNPRCSLEKISAHYFRWIMSGLTILRVFFLKLHSLNTLLYFSCIATKIFAYFCSLYKNLLFIFLKAVLQRLVATVMFLFYSNVLSKKSSLFYSENQGVNAYGISDKSRASHICFFSCPWSLGFKSILNEE